MRKKIVAGNWKMNKTVGEAVELALAVRDGCSDRSDVDVVVCPPFTALKPVSDVIANSPLKLGAQNMHAEKSGAFTGEISPAMLRDVYCHYVILGHSERRSLFGETDAVVNRKVKAALEHHLIPIVCVGETLEQREAGQTETIVRSQVEDSLEGIGEAVARLVIAYEPVWAIGTGRNATPEQAQEVHHLIREVVRAMCGAAAAQAVRIQYGGSVKPSNARELFAKPDIDGGLIGGASLEAPSFLEIVRAAV